MAIVLTMERSSFLILACFPTATLLALHPLISERIVDLSSIIDAKTVSGAGRSLSQRVHFQK